MGKKPSVLERFKASRLYVVTAPPVRGTYEQMVKAICEGGADVVQLRDKALSQRRDRFDLATRLRAICKEHGILFIVNDYLEVAMACEADGVHLGQDDMSIQEARQILHQNGVGNFLIGKSTHTLDQALQAEREGADYIGIGPVFGTPTKPMYVPVGRQMVSLVTAQVKVPHVAIGGIDASNVESVLDAGAQRVAVVRAVCEAENIVQAALQMKALVEERLLVR